MLRYILLAVLLVGCTSSQSEKHDVMKKKIRTLGVVTGGFYLNQKCHILNQQDSDKFAKYIKISMASMTDTLMTETQEINDYAKAAFIVARKIPEDPKYSSCGDDVEGIVKTSYASAKSWAG